MSARNSTIEFLPLEDWEKSYWGKILKWSLSVGRYIVIFTELVVVLALLSRFKFDRDLSDLNEQIRQQQAIMDASAQFETEFRLIQDHTNKTSELLTNYNQPNELIRDLVEIIPINVTLSNLSIRSEKITLNAQASEESGVSTFINHLKESSKFKNLRVGKVFSNKESLAINFDISFDYQP